MYHLTVLRNVPCGRLAGGFLKISKGGDIVKKVLIVEDELLARVGLRQLVNWQQLELELLEDAKDGQEAIESICTNRPEIILLDLNIAVFNGLQVLEYINTHGLTCKVIVISCNEEFDMVKEAMKAGAFDYLRKMNLSAEELTETLKKCLGAIEGETHAEFPGKKEKAEIPSSIRQEFSYEELISKNIFEQMASVSSVLCIIHPILSSQGKIYKITDYVKNELERDGIDYIQIRKGNQYGYFLFFRRFPEMQYVKLYENLEITFGAKCYLGYYENEMQENAAINEGISMAEQIIYSSFYNEKKYIWHIDQKLNYSAHTPKGVHTLLKQLSTEISGFHKEETQQILEGIFEAVIREKYTHINVLRRIFMDILGIYSMTAQSLNGSIEEIFIEEDNCHYQKVMMVTSLKDMEKWMIEFMSAFYQHFLIRYKCSQSDILKQALEYIETHLYEHIQLTEVSKSIGVSNTYLSTVFKREIGQSFVDYVNQKKTEVGKDMLLQGKLVYEVSDLLGFENSTYFSKVFKKYQQISPDMIRKNDKIQMKGTAEC